MGPALYELRAAAVRYRSRGVRAVRARIAVGRPGVRLSLSGVYSAVQQPARLYVCIVIGRPRSRHGLAIDDRPTQSTSNDAGSCIIPPLFPRCIAALGSGVGAAGVRSYVA